MYSTVTKWKASSIPSVISLESGAQWIVQRFVQQQARRLFCQSIGCAADIADSLGGVGIVEANMTSQACFCGYAFSTITF